MRGAQNSIGKIIGDQALVVIRENQRIQMLQRAEKKAEEPFLGFGAQRLAALLIDAHDVVVLCDNTRLYRGDAFRIGENAFVRDVRGAKAFLQSAPGLIIAGNSKRFHARAERRSVWSYRQ